MKALTQEELQRLLDNTGEPLRTMIQFAFFHGARVSELVGLKRADVDLRAGVVTLRRLKGSLTTQQPINDAERAGLAKVLEQHQSSPYCFLMHSGRPITRLTFWRWFKRACLENGIEASKAHPHALRHGLGFALVKANVTLPIIKRALGHVSLASTAVYTEVQDSDVGEVLKQIFNKKENRK